MSLFSKYIIPYTSVKMNFGSIEKLLIKLTAQYLRAIVNSTNIVVLSVWPITH
jgi:hypothetical protein